MSRQPVTFFLPDADEVRFVQEHRHHLADDEAYFAEINQTRRRNWIVRSYLNLAGAGYPVQISHTPPEKGLAVVCAPDFQQFQRTVAAQPAEAVPVVVRADLVYGPRGRFEIVQNGCYADETRTFLVYHWPQPGLVPRDAARGATVQNVAFFGYLGNLHPYFRSGEWKKALQQRGLRWIVSKAQRAEGRRSFNWNDYSEVDVVLAVRPDLRSLCENKPASKLVNAWAAGVPALLGPEVAYRELRQSEYDFVEIAAPEKALEAISRLIEQPHLYHEMVAQGHARSQAFTAERITERWAEVLFDKIPARVEAEGGARRLNTLLGNVRLARRSPSFRKEVLDKAKRFATRHVPGLR